MAKDTTPDSPAANAQASQEAAGSATSLQDMVQNLKSLSEDLSKVDFQSLNDDLKKVSGSLASMTTDITNKQDVNVDEQIAATVGSISAHTSLAAIIQGYQATVASGALMQQMVSAASQGCRNLIEKQPNTPEGK